MQMQDLMGQQLGNYRLTRLLGKGGFARVYLGEHIYLGTQATAAIKVLNETRLSDEDQQGFIMEARTIRKLNHPHIVKVLEFGIEVNQSGKDGSTPYLVMDYAPNGTLRTRHLRNIAVPIQQIVSYVDQVADALQYAHNQDIVHRDVKPENMLVATTGEILLSDFGIAITGHDSNKPLLVKDGVVQGTVAYIAPERFLGHTRRASDQYSLSIIVYEWLTGVRPFEGTQEQIISKHINTPPPPLYGAYPHISQEIETVVMKALAKDPEKRYSSVQEFAQALNLAARSVSQTDPKQVYQQPQANIGGQPQGQPLQAHPEQSRQANAGGQAQQTDIGRQQQVNPGWQPRAYPGQQQQGGLGGQQSQAHAGQPQQAVAGGQTQLRWQPANISGQPQAYAGQPQQGSVTGQPPQAQWQQANPSARSQAFANQPQHESVTGQPSQAQWQQANLGAQPQQANAAWQNLAYHRWQQQQAQFAGQPQGQLHLNPNPRGQQQNTGYFSEDTSRATPGFNPVAPEIPKEGPFDDLKELFSIPMRILGKWFELEPEFARIQKNRAFRNTGILLNILSAILIGILQQLPSGWIIFWGLLYSLAIFNLCIRLVNQKLSIVAGLLVALYWGYVGTVIGDSIYVWLPQLSTFLPSALLGLFFFSVSAYLHIRYVMSRLP